MKAHSLLVLSLIAFLQIRLRVTNCRQISKGLYVAHMLEHTKRGYLSLKQKVRVIYYCPTF